MSETKIEAEGKVIFPIPEDGIRYIDAVETAYALSDAKLIITPYDESGNAPANDLYVELFDMDEGRQFHRAKLCDLIERNCDLCQDETAEDEHVYVDDGYRGERWTDETAAAYERARRLSIRLMRAYYEWQRTDAKYTNDELMAHPLPTVEKPKP